MATVRRSSTSRKARSLNMPALARCRLCTRPARSGRKPIPRNIGGKTRPRRMSCCSSATCSTTKPTRICSRKSENNMHRGAPSSIWRGAPHMFSQMWMARMQTSQVLVRESTNLQAPPSGLWLRTFVIGLTAFLTVVDLFATQAILPSLTRAYGVTPAAMGFAVNASTIGMAVGGLAVGLFGRSIDQRRGILISLAVLSVPTLLLATMPALPVFTLLRVVQGLCMSTAFALTLAYLGEHASASDTASAFAAYVTGNVASNLFGRLLAAGVVDHLGLAACFYVFALLNLAGAA